MNYLLAISNGARTFLSAAVPNCGKDAITDLQRSFRWSCCGQECPRSGLRDFSISAFQRFPTIFAAARDAVGSEEPIAAGVRQSTLQIQISIFAAARDAVGSEEPIAAGVRQAFKCSIQNAEFGMARFATLHSALCTLN